MKDFTFSLPAPKNGGKISAFNYSCSLNNLTGSWYAQVAGGSFKAGNSISFANVLTGGVISKAYKDADGLWHLEGYDAGIKLARSLPDVSELPEGDAKNVIQYIADFCDIDLSMQGKGLEGFNVRSIISGSTCAEAILELSMFSGCIAFIDNNGKLNVQSPANRDAQYNFDDVIDDNGSDIDLDGYATHVLVALHRRKDKNEDNENNSEGEQHQVTHYVGKTPDTSPETKTYSGSFSNGTYSITILEPFNVIKEAKTEITENNVTVQTEENHDYEYKHKIIWREKQEYVLFAFIEKGYTLKKTTSGNYGSEENGELEFEEITSETLTRNFSIYDAIGVPQDWDGQIDMVSSETITRSTQRNKGKNPKENMPPYAPAYDSKITRNFSRENFGKGFLCKETESSYELRQVGSIAPVKKDGKLIPHFIQNTNLAIQTHSTPQWVEVNTFRTYYEQYNDDGACIISTRSEYSDDGAAWFIAHALNDTGDEELNSYEKSYSKFSQSSHGLQVSFNASGIFPAWQFIELQGRMKSYDDVDNEEGQALGNIDDWYYNGEYIHSDLCPHYNSTNTLCNVYKLAYSNSAKREKGYLHIHKGRTNGWLYCSRAVEALKLARKQENSKLEKVTIGTASAGGSSKVGYRRDFYIDDIINDDTAQELANNIAANILTVKRNKGIRKTVTIPYNTTYSLDGYIVEISHDWANLQSSITYLDTGFIPEFLIPQSVSSIAAFVSARENSRCNIPMYGYVTSVDDNNVYVKIDNSTITCNSKLRNLGQNDIVLVAFPAGNKFRGQVIARL